MIKLYYMVLNNNVYMYDFKRVLYMVCFLDGPLEYFLNFGYGSLRQLEGEQIYQKTVVGVSLVACAHLCLAENAFKCTSFDYLYEDESCYMSMYIAANVYGLMTSRSDDKKIIHYEFIGNYEHICYFICCNILICFDVLIDILLLVEKCISWILEKKIIIHSKNAWNVNVIL